MDGPAWNGELVLDVFLLAALVVTVHALGPRREASRWRWLFAAGFLASLAGMSKQVGVAGIVPLGLWIFAASRSRQRAPGLRGWWTAAFVAGGLAPLGVTVLRYGFAGELQTFWYYTVVYNARIYLAPFAGRVPQVWQAWCFDHQLWIAVGVSVLAASFARMLGRPIRSAGFFARWDRHGFELTVALGAVLSAVASYSSLREFGHYYLQAAPWAALLFGLVLERLVGRPRKWRAALAHFVVLAPLLALVTAGWLVKQQRFTDQRNANAGWWRPESAPMCGYLREKTTEDDAIYVWGFHAQYYISCERRPASRYVFSTFPAGIVPWFGSTPELEEERAVPGSKEILLRELEETKAKVIIDFPGSMMNRSIMAYPKLAEYVAKNYCPDGTRESSSLYLRKGADGRCAKPGP